MEIANNIKEIRKILSFSQEDFAREIGVSFASVNRWERGKTKPSKMALKAIDELWELTQNPRKPASEIINEYTRSRRYIGSKDRKAITNGVWDKWRKKDYPLWLKDKIPNFEKEWLSYGKALPKC